MHPLNQLVVTLIVFVCSMPSWSEDSITVVSWGGVYENAQRQAVFDPFTAATGIEVKTLTYQGGVKALRTRATSESWDVIDMIEDQAISACDAGLLARLETKEVVTRYQTVSVQEDFLPNAFRDCSVAQNIYSTVYAYDDRAFLGEKPETIKDFFDIDRFPGKRGLLRDPDVILEWALIAIGVPVGQVYDLLSTDRGLRLAFAKLESLRDSIIWWKEVGSPAQWLSDGRVVMASGYNGRFFTAVQDNGAPITIVWDGQVISYEVWGVSNSSKLKKLAKQFIQFATAPEQMAAMAELIPYGPTRQSALSRIGLHVETGVPMRDHLPNSPKHVNKALYGDSLWYARTKALRMRRFEAWLLEAPEKVVK